MRRAVRPVQSPADDASPDPLFNDKTSINSRLLQPVVDGRLRGQDGRERFFLASLMRSPAGDKLGALRYLLKRETTLLF